MCAQDEAQAKPVGHAHVARLGAQQAFGERRLDIALQTAVERVGLARRRLLGAQQDRHPPRLGNGKPRGDRHAAGDARDGVDDAGIGAGHLGLDLEPHDGGNRGGEGVLVDEVVEEASFCNSGAGDDLVDGNGVDRAVDHQIEPGSDQRGARAARAGRHAGSF